MFDDCVVTCIDRVRNEEVRNRTAVMTIVWSSRVVYVDVVWTYGEN